MYEGNDRFAPVTVPYSELPVIVNQDAEKIDRVILISLEENSQYIAFLYNYRMHVDLRNQRTGTSVHVRHPFACDIEGDVSRLASFELDNIIPIRMSESSNDYSAYLTSMNFYPKDFPENPFIDAVEEKNGDYDANYGYPYLPPRVDVEQLQLPVKVFVTTAHMHRDALISRTSYLVKRDREIYGK